MDKIITNLREFSLRSLMLISIGLSILSILLLFFTRDFNSFRLAIIEGQLANLLFISGLAVYAIGDNKRAKLILFIAAIGFLLAMYGMHGAFSNHLISYTEVPRDKLIMYYAEQISSYNITINLLYLGAFILGFSSLKTVYKAPWIIFTCVFLLYIVITILHTQEIFTDKEFSIYNTIAELLFLIGIIVVFVIGGKTNITDTKQQVSVNQALETVSITSKSEALFQLKEILNAGIISQSDFDIVKTKILKGGYVSEKQLNDLKEIKKLLDAGIINQTDFESQKQTILSPTIYSRAFKLPQ